MSNEKHWTWDRSLQTSGSNSMCQDLGGHLSTFVKVSIVWLSFIYLFISAFLCISVLKDKCSRASFLIAWLRLKPWMKINSGAQWQDVALSWLDVCLVFAVLIWLVFFCVFGCSICLQIHPFSSLFINLTPIEHHSYLLQHPNSIQLTPILCVFFHSDMKGLFKPVNQTSTLPQSS